MVRIYVHGVLDDYCTHHNALVSRVNLSSTCFNSNISNLREEFSILLQSVKRESALNERNNLNSASKGSFDRGVGRWCFFTADVQKSYGLTAQKTIVQSLTRFSAAKPYNHGSVEYSSQIIYISYVWWWCVFMFRVVLMTIASTIMHWFPKWAYLPHVLTPILQI